MSTSTLQKPHHGVAFYMLQKRLILLLSCAREFTDPIKSTLSNHNVFCKQNILKFFLERINGIRKQPTNHDTTTGFHAK